MGMSGRQHKSSMVGRHAQVVPSGSGRGSGSGSGSASGSSSGLGASNRVKMERSAHVQCLPSGGPVLGGNVVKITGVPKNYFVENSDGDNDSDEGDDNKACTCHQKPNKDGDDTESAERDSLSEAMDGWVKFSCGVELFFGLVPVPYTATIDNDGNNVLIATVPRAAYVGEVDVKLKLDGRVIAMTKYNYESALLSAPDHGEPHMELNLPSKCVSILRHLRRLHLAQFVGAIVSDAICLLANNGPTAAFEARVNVIHGEPSSILSVQAYSEYFRKAGALVHFGAGVREGPGRHQSHAQMACRNRAVRGSLGIEIWGAAVLMFAILALTDKRNTALGQKEMAPFLSLA
ncbi:hypothetical protein FVE85_0055 [Porphyridium purpureum]|uniref:Uncharacterized protein n=1 Tax=Porphyridium purpureum TaxID=35688 RepID=A0A5J4YYD5_PORPP|nr:hypothetical protein FVE85_0055 [Porphyridium purpureum]|eukprot:POR8220..scf208_2